jgi:hypothetical protein
MFAPGEQGALAKTGGAGAVRRSPALKPVRHAVGIDHSGHALAGPRAHGVRVRRDLAQIGAAPRAHAPPGDRFSVSASDQRRHPIVAANA